MTNHPRISPFWLDPTRTITRPPDPVIVDDDRRYVYAVEHGTTVYRFRGRNDRIAWLFGGDGRETLASSHPLVRAAKAAGDWPDEDEV